MSRRAHQSSQSADGIRYAARFLNYSKVVANAINLPQSKQPFFLAGDVGDNLNTPFDFPQFLIPDIYKAGISSGGEVQAFSAHFYQVAAGTNQDLLNHTRVMTHMEPKKQWRDYLAQYNIPLIMDEVNVLSGVANPTLMNGFVGSVYRVDYFLYCASIGIKRVLVESVFGSNQSVWVPYASEGTPAQTRGAYYSYLPTADFIGNTGGNTRIAQLPVNGSDVARFSAYAGYNGQTLRTVALVNFNEWSAGEGNRTITSVTLSGLTNATSVHVKYLSNPSGGNGFPDQTTYGGSQWTAASQGKEVTGVAKDTVMLRVVGGRVVVPVPFTSVAIVFA